MNEYFELQKTLKELEEKDTSKMTFEEKIDLKDSILEIKKTLNLIQNPEDPEDCVFCSS